MSRRWHGANSPSLPEHLCSIFSHHFRSMLRDLLSPPSWGLLLLLDPEPSGPAYCTEAGAAFRTLSVTLPGSCCSCSALMSQSSLSLLSPSPFFLPYLYVSSLPPLPPRRSQKKVLCSKSGSAWGFCLSKGTFSSALLPNAYWLWGFAWGLFLSASLLFLNLLFMHLLGVLRQLCYDLAY